MEKIDVKLEKRGDDYYLIIPFEQKTEVCLTKDEPQKLKGFFNTLIQELKKRKIKFEFKKHNESLYESVTDTYITQLNTEINKIRLELEENEMVIGKNESN